MTCTGQNSARLNSGGEKTFIRRPPRRMSSAPPTSSPAKPELGAILNGEVLRLSPETRTAKLSADRLILKYQPTPAYLVVSAGQWAILGRFSTGRSVPEVLRSLMTEQSCPPLRDFYELLIKAVRAGFLQTPVQPLPPPTLPAKWPLRLPGGSVLGWVVLAALLAGVGRIVLHRPDLTTLHPGWLALGWLVAAVATSVGTVLAASALRTAGGDVYRLRFSVKTLLPRLRADFGDVLFAGRRAGASVAFAQLLPLAAAWAAAAWWASGLLLPLAVALLWQLSPLWPSPLRDLLAAWYRDPELTTRHDQVLARDELFSGLKRALPGRKYLLACVVASVGWLALVLGGAGWLLRANLHDLLQRLHDAGEWRYTALTILIVLGGLVAGAVGFILWIGFSQVRSWWRARTERKLRPAAVLVSPQTTAEWLARTALFRELPAEELQAVAAVVKAEEHKRGSWVVREGEAGERLYVVLSGRLEVRRDFAPGKSEPVAEMREGDVFGEIALLQGGVRTRSIRTLERSVLLALDKTDFERLVLSKLSRQGVESAVQKTGFLQQTALTRNWSQAAMAAFAQRAQFREAAQGDVILEENSRNIWFFLVHRGELVVKHQGRELRRLRTGDAFGELSLFGDGTVTASVVVTSKHASLLLIAGRDFLEFIAHDFVAALDWEATRKRRVEHDGKKKRS